MKADILIKINSDPKLKEFINNNSYWYKYLNRGGSYYKNFMDAYKGYKKNERINKTNNILETVDTFNSILKILK